MLFNWWDIFEQVCQSSRSRISTECLTIHYRKYKNNEKTVIFKRRGQDIQNSGWWHRRRQLDHPMVLMLEMSHDCMCVCVGCVSVCVCKLLCIQCILYFCVCVGVRTNSINIKVRHISFIKKQFGQRRGQCSQHVCPKQAYLGPGVYCVFYIACVTLSNTVH